MLWASELANRLARDAEAVCRHYLSAGRRAGNYWIVGDTANSKGKSLYVHLTGPRAGRSPPPIAPQTTALDDVHEVVGTGSLFPDAHGAPILHVHLACGRGDRTVTGCIRTGVKTWHVLEVILVELLGSTARRLHDPATGFELLAP